MSYCTPDELTAYLGLTESGDNWLLEQLIAAAGKMIERQTGRVFAVEADGERRFNPIVDCRGRTLFLTHDLADAPTSVVNGDGATLAVTDYVTEPRTERPVYALRLLASSGVTWTWGADPEDAIRVTGKWGYSVAPPEDIRHACIRLAAFLYRQRDNAGDSDRTIVTQAGVVKPLTVPGDIALILAPYRRLT